MARAASFQSLAATLIVVLAVAAPAAAQQRPGAEPPLPTVLYGMGPDPRERVHMNEMPWRAVGRVLATAGSLAMACTGSLIAPAKVLTAAHCVYNERTHSNWPPEALHFLLGFESDHYTAEAKILSYKTGAGYEPENGGKTRGSDWAVLTIDKPLGTYDTILTLRDKTPPAGTRVTIGGYNRDYRYIIIADEHCRILGMGADDHGRPLLIDDCTAKQGTSGAPVLVYDNGRWTIAGVHDATARNDTRGVASIPDAAAALR